MTKKVRNGRFDAEFYNVQCEVKSEVWKTVFWFQKHLKKSGLRGDGKGRISKKERMIKTTINCII